MSELTQSLQIAVARYPGTMAELARRTAIDRSTLYKIINGQRKVRIARGSGRTVDEVNRLMKQFEDMKKMMKMMQGGGGGAMARMMGGMGGRRPM